jgi:hypothetical protein
MDITKREKRNPRSTLFEKLILKENNWENYRTSLPLTTGHRGRRRRGGERPEELPERGLGRDGMGIGESPQGQSPQGQSRTDQKTDLF